MVIGDLGADVIKVEPVTGDGMRFGEPAVLRLPARQARHRARSQERRGHEIALQLVEHADIVHHNMTAGVAVRLGIGYEDCKRVNDEHRLLQHVGVRLRGPARALRRSRPALPGVGRARVRAGTGARGQPAELSPLRDDRRGQRDALGRRLPRGALPPAGDRRGSGAVDVAARRRVDVRVRRDARRR